MATPTKPLTPLVMGSGEHTDPIAAARVPREEYVRWITALTDVNLDAWQQKTLAQLAREVVVRDLDGHEVAVLASMLWRVVNGAARRLADM